MIEYDIIAAVKADSILNTLIGGRIYPNQIKQGNTYPMVALLMNEKEPLTGQSGICGRSYDALFAVSSTSRKECLIIGERLISLFNKKVGIMGDSNVLIFRYVGTGLDALQNDTMLYYVGYEFEILININ
jgi:hypothetical protein